ncbi:MAG TPA: HlyD family efflux transporter periplasmic adaptor subunit [Thermoanaerobaculia bacterium]|nr:HlyD family efflux transporter periplasmic adaptor subunit [Thermoanaerobaculia bacterium]
MKRGRIAVLLLLVAAGAVAFWAFGLRKREEPLVLSGSIEARDAEVGSLVGGRVAEVHVEEGSRVRMGDPIVTFETDLGALQIREQRARVEEMRAGLARVTAGPRSEETARARAESENAERERRRLKALFDEGVIGRQQYEDVATRARVAHESYRQLQRGSRAEDLAAARAALDREGERLAFLLRQSEEAFVRAPADGVVESLDLRPGDLVAPNRPVARILEPGQLWVRVWVPEPSLGHVRLGQPVAITVDSFPAREFPGRIVEIRQQGEYTPRNVQTRKQRMDQVFGAKVAIDPAPELKPGMAAEVRLKESR